jgi:hypothetical protein
MSLDSRQRDRAGQEESAGIGASIDRPPHEVPALRHMLPLVNQNGRYGVEKSKWIRASDAALCGVIKGMNRGGAPTGSCGLPHPLGTNNCQSRKGVG